MKFAFALAVPAALQKGMGGDVPPEIQYISIGNSAPGTFNVDPGDPIMARRGAPGRGYYTRAKAGWTSPQLFDVLTDDTCVIGLTAWHNAPIAYQLAGDLRGIEHVWVCANGGDWYEAKLGIHPVYGNECYLTYIRKADMPASGELELIAVAQPYNGYPFALQGQPDARTINIPSPGGTLHRVNHTFNMWSMLLSVDKTGSDLPHARVFKASDDDPAGSDSNDGLTYATPLKTWPAVLAKIMAIHETSDVGGAHIYLTSSQNHEFGLPDSPAPSITAAAKSWLRIMPAPGLAKADVKIARQIGTHGLYCERVSIENVQSSATLTNCDPANVQANNYLHMRVIGIDHDGGDGVDEFGQPNGPQFVQAANGHLQAVNCTISNCYASGFNCLTLDIGCTTDNLSENRDMTINPKVSIRLKVKNQTDLSGGNHCDAAQFTNGRRMHIVEDLDATEGNHCEGLFSDTIPNEDIVYIRPRIDVGSYTGPSIGINGKPTGYLIVDPICVGGTTQIWPATPPYANDCAMILTEESQAGNLASQARYGFSVIHPGDTVDPDVNPPAENEFVTLFGANVVDVVDANSLTTVSHSGPGTAVTEWRCDMVGGGPGPYAVPAAPNRPTWNPTGFGGQFPTVDCVAGVSALGRSSVPDSIEGANPCEIFLWGRHDEPASSTTSRFVMTYGGAGAASSRYVRRTAAGGLNKVSFHITATGNVVTAPGDFSGEFILHVYYDGALGYGIGLFTADQPEGAYATATLGAAPSTQGLRVVMSGDYNDVIGIASSRAAVGWNGKAMINRVLTSDERAAAIAIARARVNW